MAVDGTLHLTPSVHSIHIHTPKQLPPPLLRAGRALQLRRAHRRGDRRVRGGWGLVRARVCSEADGGLVVRPASPRKQEMKAQKQAGSWVRLGSSCCCSFAFSSFFWFVYTNMRACNFGGRACLALCAVFAALWFVVWGCRDVINFNAKSLGPCFETQRGKGWWMWHGSASHHERPHFVFRPIPYAIHPINLSLLRPGLRALLVSFSCSATSLRPTD